MDELDSIQNSGGIGMGVPTGFMDLDERTHGLHPGQMVVIAARPAVGKSTLALDIARSCSIKNNLTSAIFSLEMSKSEITMRLLSAESRVPLTRMRSGRMDDQDWSRLAAENGEVAEAPLYIDDSPNLTMMEIRAKARRLKQRHDLRLIVVDYLQLMTSGKKVESRQQEVSEFSRALKLLSKELEVPVVALSQLNRGPSSGQTRSPCSPTFASPVDRTGRGHGDAAAPRGLYEPESPRAGEADLILAKHRNGPTGTVTVSFQGHYSRFTDMAG
jgi:replicative DNA helicase